MSEAGIGQDVVQILECFMVMTTAHINNWMITAKFVIEISSMQFFKNCFCDFQVFFLI
jgi:hypothetical protein